MQLKKLEKKKKKKFRFTLKASRVASMTKTSVEGLIVSTNLEEVAFVSLRIEIGQK